MVLRSRPVRRAIADTLKPWRARSRIMTSSPSVTIQALPQSTEGTMGYERLHGSKASAPEPCRCVSLGKVHPPNLRSIHPALTAARRHLGQALGQPSAQVVQQRHRFLLAHRQALGGQKPIDTPLNTVQRGDLLHALGGDRRALGLVHDHCLADPKHRHAGTSLSGSALRCRVR
jgi:hypothetical protein